MLIYKITFPNGKVYIGQTIHSLKKRKAQHLGKLKNPKKSALHNAINLYGKENITWDIIDTASNKEDLNTKEIYWIKVYNSIPETEGGWGYNLTLGGNSCNHSQESKDKMSTAKKGKKFLSQAHYKKLSKKFKGSGNPFYGKTHSLEVREKVIKAQTGRRKTDSEKLKKAKVRPFYVFDKHSPVIIGEFRYIKEFCNISKCPERSVRYILQGLAYNTKIGNLSYPKQSKGYTFKYVDLYHGN